MKRTVSVSSLGQRGSESPTSVLDHHSRISNQHLQQSAPRDSSVPASAPAALPSSKLVGLEIVAALGRQHGLDLSRVARLTRSSIARTQQQRFYRQISQPITSPPPSFLQFCCLCKKAISYGRDIYMYRGIQAFCSMDCRDQQIFRDEKLERKNACAHHRSRRCSHAPKTKAAAAAA